MSANEAELAHFASVLVSGIFLSFCPCVVFSAGSQVFSSCKVTLVNTASLQRQHFCCGLTLSKHVIVVLCLLIVNSFSSISLVKDSCKGSKMFTPMTKTENSHRNDSWCRLKVSVSQMHCKKPFRLISLRSMKSQSLLVSVSGSTMSLGICVCTGKCVILRI